MTRGLLGYTRVVVHLFYISSSIGLITTWGGGEFATRYSEHVRALVRLNLRRTDTARRFKRTLKRVYFSVLAL